MEQKEKITLEIRDSLYWLKICFAIRQEMRILEENQKTELYVFTMMLVLNEEEKVWKRLEEELSK